MSGIGSAVSPGSRLAYVIVIVAGAVFYTPQRHWAQGQRPGDRVSTEPFSTALPECLEDHDPAGLAKFERTGSYQISGWFASEASTQEVARCMRPKGWLLVPTHIYTP